MKEVVSEKGDTTFVYKIATNPEIVKQLKGHLMLVHGDIDNNVHDANTIRVVNALIRANKRFEMLILPVQKNIGMVILPFPKVMKHILIH